MTNSSSRGWIRVRRLLVSAGALLLVSSLAGAAASPVTVVTLNTSQGKLTELLQAEVANAGKQAKVPFVQITAEWCGPCKALRASMNDALMRDAFAGTYIIRIDMDEWMPQLEAAGLKTQAVPIFFAVDKSGRPTGAKLDGGAWGEDIPRNMAPPLSRFFRKNGAKP